MFQAQLQWVTRSWSIQRPYCSSLSNQPSRARTDYSKHYYQEHKEQILQSQKAYYNQNKEQRKSYKRSYNEANKHKISETQSRYYQEHKDQLNQKHKMYQQTHKQQISEWKKQYQQTNKQKLDVYQTQYVQQQKEKVLKLCIDRKQEIEKLFGVEKPSDWIRVNSHRRILEKNMPEFQGATKYVTLRDIVQV